MKIQNILLVISALFIFGCPDNNYSDDYESVNEINIINIDGTNKIRVVETEYISQFPQFIPNTDEIIYQVSNYETGDGIYKVKTAGGQPQLLVSGSNPVINDDGSILAFTTQKIDWIDSLSNSDYNTSNHLAIMDTDGTNKFLLTYSATDSTLENIYNPLFSSDGQNIVFSRELSLSDSFISAIYTVNLNGELKRLFDLDRTYGVYPHFIPNSDEIIFNTGNRYHQKLLNYNITTGDTTEIVTIYECGGLDVSPDGSKIVYSTVSGFHKEIFIIDIDGQNKKRLTSNSEGDSFTPVFSPDGSKVVFELKGKHQEYSNILLVDVNSATSIQFTNDDRLLNSSPRFSHDGNKVVFSTTSTRIYYY